MSNRSSGPGQGMGQGSGAGRGRGGRGRGSHGGCGGFLGAGGACICPKCGHDYEKLQKISDDTRADLKNFDLSRGTNPGCSVQVSP